MTVIYDLVTNNIKMKRTKKLSAPQNSDLTYLSMPDITLCSACNGTGEKGDVGRDLSKFLLCTPCEKCKATGRA